VPTSTIPLFYRPDALPAAQPTVSKHLVTEYRQYLHFVRRPLKPPLHDQSPSRYRSYKASYSKLRSKIGCHGNVPPPLDPHLKHDSLGHPSPQPKPHLDLFSRFCTDDCRMSQYFTVGCPFPLTIAPSHWGSEPPTCMVPWAHPNPQPKRSI